MKMSFSSFEFRDSSSEEDTKSNTCTVCSSWDHQYMAVSLPLRLTAATAIEGGHSGGTITRASTARRQTSSLKWNPLKFPKAFRSKALQETIPALCDGIPNSPRKHIDEILEGLSRNSPNACQNLDTARRVRLHFLAGCGLVQIICLENQNTERNKASLPWSKKSGHVTVLLKTTFSVS